jgi:hypothetical protein
MKNFESNFLLPKTLISNVKVISKQIFHVFKSFFFLSNIKYAFIFIFFENGPSQKSQGLITQYRVQIKPPGKKSK